MGQAAVQLAKAAGAQIFATASPEKWDFLKSQGITFVMNSRNTDFTSQIMKITDGKGVDIVLNSLSGNFIEKSFSVLAQGGRFVEIGKTDVWDTEKAAAFRPDVTYYLFDMGEVTSENPKKGSDILAHLKNSFEEGKLEPPPLKIYAVTHAADAFRYMLLAKHIGKIVLDFEGLEDTLIRKEGIYLITGGLGGLGLKVSQWLAEQGAGHLLLAGRSGANSDQAKLVIAELEAAGISVKVVKADISKAKDVKNILNICEEKCLRGIIHAAGILEDGVLEKLDAIRFAKAMAPKVHGAWLLHRMTAHMKLDFFLCFSSSTSLLGYGGQGNYAAANAFLDALAHYRRKLGLPAHTINWGAWSEVGMSARMSQRDLDRMQAHGEGMISPDRGIKTMDSILKQTAPQPGVLPIRWPEYFRSLPEIPPFLSLLHTGTEQKQIQKTDSASQFSNLSQGEIYNVLMEKTATEIRYVLGLDSSQIIDPEEGFYDMGLDSLTAIELRNRLQKITGLSLGATIVFDYPSVKDLANYLAEELSKNRPSKPENHEENDAQHSDHEQHTCTKEQKIIKDVLYSSAEYLEHSTLVRIQPNGSKAPIFMIPGILGSVFDFLILSKHLDEEQPVYALRSLGLDENVEPYTRIEDMASHNINMIKTVQPQGPYFLVAHSFGCWIAFEMALQLHQQNRQVLDLILLDVPKKGCEADNESLRFHKNFIDFFRIYSLGLGKQWEIPDEIFHPSDEEKAMNLLLKKINSERNHLALSDIKRKFKVYSANCRAEKTYIPHKRDSIRIKVLLAEELLGFDSLPDHKERIQICQALSSEPVEIEKTPGNHFTMLHEPHVIPLANKIRAYLDQGLPVKKWQ